MLGHNDECMEDIPQWYFYNFDIDSEDASFAIKCNGKFFHIDVLAKDLGDWSGKEEFLRLIQDASDDYDAEKSLYELISDPCVLLLRTYAPSAEDTNPFNLQKYYSPETFVFKLIGNGNDIKAVRCPLSRRLRKNCNTITPNRFQQSSGLFKSPLLGCFDHQDHTTRGSISRRYIR